MKNVSDESCRKKKSGLLVYFFPENHAVYEIKWKNILESDRPQMKTWRTHIAYWIPKGTKTHTRIV